MSSPAPIDTTLPDLMIPKNPLNKLSMNEYVGDEGRSSSTVGTTASQPSETPSAVTSASSGAEVLSVKESWLTGLLAFAGIYFFAL
ncbi:hypothetical protein CVT26_015670 [Gymnopilus dilepis]|uniref:Uncharacterized protein n=1 Tax=Gymnopilus dilepis TaxID=231916 RepID=A0A409VFB8_9AGAR|nr:hypothetical protein CVT26_015670 [Gymnopilus dilepis]